MSENPVLLSFSDFFFAFVQFIAAVIWTLQIYSISDFSLRQKCLYGGLDVSSVNWTSRRCIGLLDGALNVSDMIWTLSKGPKESYKYDLANPLVLLIVLSRDH